MTRFQLAKLSEEKPLFLNPDSATKLLWAAILGKAIQFPTVSRWTFVPPLPWPLSLQGRRSTKTLKNSRIYKTSSHQPSPGSLRSPRYISFQIFCLIYLNSLWSEVFPTTTASSYESRARMRQVRIILRVVSPLSWVVLLLLGKRKEYKSLERAFHSFIDNFMICLMIWATSIHGHLLMGNCSIPLCNYWRLFYVVSWRSIPSLCSLGCCTHWGAWKVLISL